MRDFAFGKENFILVAIAVAIIVIGFALMVGGSTTEEAFNPSIFDTQRIVVAPLTCLAGFVLMIYAIVRKSKK